MLSLRNIDFEAIHRRAFGFLSSVLDPLPSLQVGVIHSRATS